MSNKKGSKKGSGKGSKSGKFVSSNPKITNPNRKVDATKQPHLRDKATIQRLAMYSEKARHDKFGKFVSGKYMSRVPDEKVKRVPPDRSLRCRSCV